MALLMKQISQIESISSHSHESKTDLKGDLVNKSVEKSDAEWIDKKQTTNKTIALNKENLNDKTTSVLPSKMVIEEAAQFEESYVEKPVKRRDADGPVQDQPEKETSTHKRVKTEQDELVNQMVSIILAFLLNSCSNSQNLIQYILFYLVKFFFD